MPTPLPEPPPQWSDDHFRDTVPTPGTSVLERGLVGHVPILSVLMIVQGALELLFSLFGAAFVAIVFLMPVQETGDLRGSGVLMAIMAVPALLVGLLRIAAGLANLRYRRRTLGMTAALVGLGSVLTCYCAPTAIALAVYGLVVFLNESVIAAFELGARGKSTTEVQAAFPPAR